MSDHPDPLPASRFCNRYNNPNPIQGEGALGDRSAGRMYFQGQDQRDLVRRVQRMLLELGYDLGSSGPEGDGVDGEFGRKTDEAVKQFQEEHRAWDGEPLQADGLVGPRTADALNRLMVGPWYEHYQTPVEITEGGLCHSVTAEFLVQGLSIQPAESDQCKIFLAGLIITPRTAPLEGETRVRIQGGVFAEGSSVSVGGREARDLRLANSSRFLFATLPSGGEGVAEIVVSTPGQPDQIIRPGMQYVSPVGRAARATISSFQVHLEELRDLANTRSGRGTLDEDLRADLRLELDYAHRKSYEAIDCRAASGGGSVDDPVVVEILERTKERQSQLIEEALRAIG